MKGDASKVVMVTGGCGYIGVHTIVDLLEKGYDVISVDNLSRSSDVILKGVHQITGKTVKNYKVDLKDSGRLKEVFESNPDIHAIIHFAAYKVVRESVDEPTMYYENNIGSLIAILAAARDHQIQNFVFSSSCSVFGNSDILPVKEDTPLQQAESPYAHTKQIGERIIEHFSKVNKGNYISLRYFNPVGAHHSALIGEVPSSEPENLVPLITLTASGKIPELKVHGNDYETPDGTCIRDYIHVMDIAEAHTKAMEYVSNSNTQQGHTLFNLGSGTGTSVLEAITAFEKANGLKLNYSTGPKRKGDVAAIYADNTLAFEKLSWKPTRDLNEIMTSAWQWQLKLNTNKNT